jgi:hypothetical protein
MQKYGVHVEEISCRALLVLAFDRVVTASDSKDSGYRLMMQKLKEEYPKKG